MDESVDASSARRVLDGRYELREAVGSGGMARVYQARDRRLDRIVAVKVLHSHLALDAAVIERFQREARQAAALPAHPHIVSMYDVGHEGDTHFIVLEYVRGASLGERLSRTGALGTIGAVSLARQIAAALSHAHRHGLIHRDITPHNILLTADGIAKVADFGIAWLASSVHLTQPGMVLGTAHYMSPEQARGEPAGPGSDIYSLGIVLYEMLTGCLPFQGESLAAVSLQHANLEPPDPRSLDPTIPAEVAGVVRRALDKSTAGRFPTATAFLLALPASTEHRTDQGAISPEGDRLTAPPFPIEPTAVEPLFPRGPEAGRPNGRRRIFLTRSWGLRALAPLLVLGLAVFARQSALAPAGAAVNAKPARAAPTVSSLTGTAATSRPATQPTATAQATVGPSTGQVKKRKPAVDRTTQRNLVPPPPVPPAQIQPDVPPPAGDSQGADHAGNGQGDSSGSGNGD